MITSPLTKRKSDQKYGFVEYFSALIPCLNIGKWALLRWPRFAEIESQGPPAMHTEGRERSHQHQPSPQASPPATKQFGHGTARTTPSTCCFTANPTGTLAFLGALP